MTAHADQHRGTLKNYSKPAGYSSPSVVNSNTGADHHRVGNNRRIHVDRRKVLEPLARAFAYLEVDRVVDARTAAGKAIEQLRILGLT
jgi:hypothetical protein